MDKPADTDRNDRLFTIFGIEKKFECEFYIIIVEKCAAFYVVGVCGKCQKDSGFENLEIQYTD